MPKAGFTEGMFFLYLLIVAMNPCYDCRIILRGVVETYFSLKTGIQVYSLWHSLVEK